MFYDKGLLIPPNTPKSAPLDVEVKLTHGVIHYIEVQFPAGCAGLAHLVILHQEHQLYPTNPEGSFAADNYVIPMHDYFELFYAPFTVVLRGWNLDDTYPHTVTARLAVIQEDVAAYLYGRRKIADRESLLKAFGLPPPGV